jgi:hypothetical protein
MSVLMEPLITQHNTGGRFLSSKPSRELKLVYEKLLQEGENQPLLMEPYVPLHQSNGLEEID